MAESGITHFEVDGAHFMEQGDICEMCENTASVGYCSECECYICQLCFDNHIKIRKYRHHVLQIATESKEDDRTVHFKTCTEHTQQEVRLYCTDHKCFGCAECIEFHHKSCKTKYITEASKEFQESGELARFLQDIRDLENVHQNCIKSIASQSERSDNINRTTTHTVQQFVKDVVSYLTDEEKLIINVADSNKSINNDKIEKLSDDLHRIGSDISSISDNVKENDMIHKIFILVEEAKPKLSQIRDTLTAIDCQEVIDSYTFYPSRLLKRQLSDKRPIGKLSDNAQSEQDDVDDYECKYKAGCAENQQLQQQLSSQEKIMYAQKQDNQRLQQKLSTQEKLNKILQQQLSSREMDITRCQQQLSTQELENIRLQQQLSTQEKEIEQLQQQLSTQEQDNAKLQQQLSTQEQDNAKLQQQWSTQEKEIKQLQQQLSTQEQDNAKLQQQQSTQEKKIERLQQQLSTQEQDNTKLQQQLSTQEQDNAKLQQQQSTQEQDNTKLQEQLSTQEQDNTKLQQQLSTQEQDNAKLQQQQSTQEQDNTKLQQQLSTQEQDNAKLQQQQSTQEKEIERLQQQLSTQEQDNTKLQQQLSTQEQDNAKLQQQQSTQEQDNTKLQQQLSTQEQDNTKLQQQQSTQEKEIERLQQQLSTQEQDNQRKALQILKLERDINKLRENGLILACGHVCDVARMNKNRTIKCPSCDVIFGDQPTGTLSTEEHEGYIYYIELKFRFHKGTQSKLNLNPGKPYEGNEVKGYIDDCGDGQVILKMLKLAFDQQLLFTINRHGQIVTNGIDIFAQPPPCERNTYEEYSGRVKQQLEAKGITEADVS